MSDEKAKALGIAISQIEKSWGKGSIMKMDKSSKLDLEVIPSGTLALDLALGVGGFPKGRIIEIYGPEGGGKTTVSLQAIAEAQKKGGIAAFIDAEHALSPVYAQKLGVDINNLLISQPDYGEQALEIAETLIRSGAVDIIVVDSVAALVPKAEIEGEMGDIQMGAQARLMSKALRKLTAVVGKSKTVMIFINQLREKIGIMFGNPEVTPGGRALKFYSSVRLEVRASEKIKEGDRIIGSKVRVKVVKNKVAAPFREGFFTLINGEGISKSADLLDTGINVNIIAKSGAWFMYGEEKLGQGYDNAVKTISENRDIAKKLEAEIRKIIANPPKTAAAEVPTEKKKQTLK